MISSKIAFSFEIFSLINLIKEEILENSFQCRFDIGFHDFILHIFDHLKKDFYINFIYRSSKNL